MFHMFSSFASEAIDDARKLARLYHFCINKYKKKVEVAKFDYAIRREARSKENHLFRA